MRLRGSLQCALVIAGALALAGPVYAQSPAEINLAKQTAGEGLAAYNAGAFDKALALFSQARKIYPSAQILRMIGYSELALEHWGNAVDALDLALDSSVTPLSKDDQKDVHEQIAKAMKHLGTVTVSSKVAAAALSVDGGEPRRLPLDRPLHLPEGPHRLVVTAPEHLDAARDLAVLGGQSIEVALDPAEKPAPRPLPPPPPPPPRSESAPGRRAAGFALAGAGVAFGGAALVTILEAAHWRSMAASDAATHLSFYGDRCAMGDPRLCAFDVAVTNREADVADQLRNAAAGLGIAAAVLAATGVVLVVVSPRERPRPPDAASVAKPPISVRCGVGGGPGLLCAGAF